MNINKFFRNLIILVVVFIVSGCSKSEENQPLVTPDSSKKKTDDLNDDLKFKKTNDDKDLTKNPSLDQTSTESLATHHVPNLPQDNFFHSIQDNLLQSMKTADFFLDESMIDPSINNNDNDSSEKSSTRDHFFVHEIKEEPFPLPVEQNQKQSIDVPSPKAELLKDESMLESSPSRSQLVKKPIQKNSKDEDIGSHRFLLPILPDQQSLKNPKKKTDETVDSTTQPNLVHIESLKNQEKVNLEIDQQPLIELPKKASHLVAISDGKNEVLIEADKIDHEFYERFKIIRLNDIKHESKKLRKFFINIFNLKVDPDTLEKIRMNAEFFHPTSKEMAVFFYPESPLATHDHSSKIFFSLNDARIYRILKHTQKSNVHIKLINSNNDIHDTLAMLSSKGYDIIEVEIGAHGNLSEIALGPDDNNPAHHITKSSIKDLGLKYIHKQATLLLSACQTGQGDDNIAKFISLEAPHIYVSAPNKSITGHDILRHPVKNKDMGSPQGDRSSIYVPIIFNDDLSKFYKNGINIKSKLFK